MLPVDFFTLFFISVSVSSDRGRNQLGWKLPYKRSTASPRRGVRFSRPRSKFETFYHSQQLYSFLKLDACITNFDCVSIRKSMKFVVNY
jgi:hypothetical protein